MGGNKGIQVTKGKQKAPWSALDLKFAVPTAVYAYNPVFTPLSVSAGFTLVEWHGERAKEWGEHKNFSLVAKKAVHLRHFIGLISFLLLLLEFVGVVQLEGHTVASDFAPSDEPPVLCLDCAAECHSIADFGTNRHLCESDLGHLALRADGFHHAEGSIGAHMKQQLLVFLQRENLLAVTSPNEALQQAEFDDEVLIHIAQRAHGAQRLAHQCISLAQ